jgi:FkbM family methyltransferase
MNILRFLKKTPLPLYVKKQLMKIDGRFVNYLNFKEDEEFIIDNYWGGIKAIVNPSYPIEASFILNEWADNGHGVFQCLLEPGNVGIDVGANVGLVTLAMAKTVGETGHVIAIEPGTILYERLQRNLSLNPALKKRVTSHQIGVSDKSGILFWQEDKNNRGNAGLNNTVGEAVNIETLDVLLEGYEAIDFIKIDVEGMEYEVIKGAEKILIKHKPILFYETHSVFLEVRRKTLFTEISEFLERLNYKLFDLDKQNKLIPIAGGEKLPSDTIAIHKSSKFFPK